MKKNLLNQQQVSKYITAGRRSTMTQKEGSYKKMLKNLTMPPGAEQEDTHSDDKSNENIEIVNQYESNCDELSDQKFKLRNRVNTQGSN